MSGRHRSIVLPCQDLCHIPKRHLSVNESEAVGIRPQTQADLAKEVYSPMEPLVFGPDKKLCVYRCAPDLATLKWKKHLPKPPMALLSGLAVYKFFIAYSGFIWGLLPLLPILPLYGMQANINGNAEVQLEHIYL